MIEPKNTDWLNSNLLFLLLFISIGWNGHAQSDSLPPRAELIGDVGANSYTAIYPLGWSKKGHFAYVQLDLNGMGGADIWKFQLFVHHEKRGIPEFEMSTVYNFEEDSTLWDLELAWNKETDTLFWGNQNFRELYWYQNFDTIQSVLNKYNIIRSDKQAVKPIEVSNNFGFKVTVDRDRDTENAIVLDRSINVYVQFTGGIKRAIYSKTNALNADGWAIDYYGNYTDLLYYEVQGFIKSPHSDHYLLYLVEFSMGFEETAERIILLPFSKNF